MAKQMTLGQLIDVLERKDPEASIDYAFGYFSPTRFHSWRGAYEELSLGYGHWTEIGGFSNRPTVASLLALSIEADGKTFTGYKGGEYTMDRDRRIWISNNNESCQSGIADVIEGDVGVVIVPGYFTY